METAVQAASAIATIEGMIQRNTITFETLITTTNFNLAWQHRSDIVFDFLVEHTDILCEYAFLLNNDVRRSLNLICLAFLQSKDLVFYEKLFNSSEFCSFVNNFTKNIANTSIKSQSLFYHTLTTMLTSTNFAIFKRININDFFGTICANLHYDTPARFIQSTVLKLTPASFVVLRESKLCTILLNEYINGTMSGTIALRLMHNCFANEYFLTHVAETFSEKDILENLRKISFTRKDPHGVDFLRYLYTTSQQFKNYPHWCIIANELLKDLPEISKLLVECKNFGIYENSIGKLFVVLTDGIGYVDSLGFKTVCMSVDQLFLNPVNSFIHNFAVQCVRLLCENRGDVSKLLKETKLPARIIEKYNDRQNDSQAVYWGQLRVISDYIEPFVEKSEYPKWDGTVNKKNKETRKVLDLPEKETFPLVPTKHGKTWILYLHRLPEKKRFIFVTGFISIILFIYMTFFV